MPSDSDRDEDRAPPGRKEPPKIGIIYKIT